MSYTSNYTGPQVDAGIAKTAQMTTTSGKTYTFPATDASLARTDAAQTFSGVQTFSNTVACSATGVQEKCTTYGNRFCITDTRTVSATGGFLKFSFGTGTVGAIIRVTAAGAIPGYDDIGTIWEWAVTRRAGSGTAMTITSLHSQGPSGGCITCTQSTDDIVLSYVMLSAYSYSLWSYTEFIGISSTGGAYPSNQAITATVL